MIADRVRVQTNILIPFQKESPAVLSSKFLNKVKIQNLIPQTELNFRILSRTKASSKADYPSQRAFQNSIPFRVEFQYPQWSLKNLKILSPVES